MKIDFHTHGKLAKNIYFSKEYTKNMFDKARERGLDAICLTEHFNTSYFDELYEYILSISARDGDTLILNNGLRIFPGIEVEIMEGGHLLCIGKMKNILTIRKKITGIRGKYYFITFKELQAIIDYHPVLLGAAHPFRTGDSSNIPNLPDEDLQRFDFIDLNGKDLAVENDDMEERVINFAKSINKPVLAGSDTHQENNYGVVYNTFERDINTIEDIRKEILEGRYEIFVSDYIKEKVASALYIKSLLKEIDALGGNYVKAALMSKV